MSGKKHRDFAPLQQQSDDDEEDVETPVTSNDDATSKVVSTFRRNTTRRPFFSRREPPVSLRLERVQQVTKGSKADSDEEEECSETEHVVPSSSDEEVESSDAASESLGKQQQDKDEDEEDDGSEYSDYDDEDDNDASGCMPSGAAILLIPFLLLTIAIAVAYMGRRQDEITTTTQTGGHANAIWSNGQDNEVLDITNHPLYKNAYKQTIAIPSSTNSSVVYKISPTAQQQIQNYQSGAGLLLNIQLVNQAGHAVCQSLGHAMQHAPGGTPTNKDCRVTSRRSSGDGTNKKARTRLPVGYPDYYPWNYQETAANIQEVRKYHHYISWRFSHASAIPLHETAWEDPNLISILVIRHPLDRMLAFDTTAAQHWPAVFSAPPSTTAQTFAAAAAPPGTLKQHVQKYHDNNTFNYNYNNSSSAPAQPAHMDASYLEAWNQFAHSDYTDNYSLRILSGQQDCCQGARTKRSPSLTLAKNLVNRFTLVLDMACLDESLNAAADLLGMDRKLLGVPKHHAKPVERIPTKGLYNYLQRKNQLDIQLYEWARRSRALVKCDDDK